VSIFRQDLDSEKCLIPRHHESGLGFALNMDIMEIFIMMASCCPVHMTISGLQPAKLLELVKDMKFFKPHSIM